MCDLTCHRCTRRFPKTEFRSPSGKLTKTCLNCRINGRERSIKITQQKNLLPCTYTHGFDISFLKNITKDNLYHICIRLSDRLNIKVRPEAISEGGLLFKVNRGYKSLRFNVTSYPWIEPDTFEEWENNNDIIIDVSQQISPRRPTFLKAFYGAPPFTIDELQSIQSIFYHYGIIRKGNYPLKRNLICYDMGIEYHQLQKVISETPVEPTIDPLTINE